MLKSLEKMHELKDKSYTESEKVKFLLKFQKKNKMNFDKFLKF